MTLHQTNLAANCPASHLSCKGPLTFPQGHILFPKRAVCPAPFPIKMVFKTKFLGNYLIFFWVFPMMYTRAIRVNKLLFFSC